MAPGLGIAVSFLSGACHRDGTWAQYQQHGAPSWMHQVRYIPLGMVYVSVIGKAFLTS